MQNQFPQRVAVMNVQCRIGVELQQAAIGQAMIETAPDAGVQIGHQRFCSIAALPANAARADQQQQSRQ